MFPSITASISELRAFVAAHNITVVGDRRRKSTFHNAIDQWEVDNICVQQIDDLDVDSPSPEFMGTASVLTWDEDHDEDLAREIGIAEGIIEPTPMAYLSDEMITIFASLGHAEAELELLRRDALVAVGKTLAVLA